MRNVLLPVAILTTITLGFIAVAHADTPKLGSFYTMVGEPSPPSNPSKIRVQEFFWFGCPHCFRLDPLISKWAKTLPKDVVFERVPDNLGNAVGVLDEQAFYVAKLLGIERRIHTPLFDAIQIQRLPLDTRAALQQFLVKTGHITPEEYSAAADSFEVDSNVRRADQMAYDDQILSVPTIVIGGEYRLDAGLPGYASFGGRELARDRKMLQVASWLIKKVRTERNSGT